jgi:hypothetical protein
VWRRADLANKPFCQERIHENEFMTPFSEPSFYQGDRDTYRRIAIVGTLCCLAFGVISFSRRPQLEDTRAAVKADRLVRTAGQAPHAN